ncbi:MAG: hypothetical protein O8C63_09595 [Candidatus Methanoperedens sp.]|nr:hypothetical protein [Candidatus Methanoperedens sp.]
MSNWHVKAKGLVARAVHPNTPENEAFASAMLACKLIAKHDLLDSPIDGIMENVNNETVRAAGDLFKHLSDPEFVRSVKKITSELRRKRS